jgi:hypothetical protein
LFVAVLCKTGADFGELYIDWSGRFSLLTVSYLFAGFDGPAPLGETAPGIYRGRSAPGGASSIYKITQLLPLEGDDFQYKIKSVAEPHERVAKESQLDRAA